MKIGFIGLGKMGAQMVGKLLTAGHEVIATDLNKQALDTAAQQGAVVVEDRTALVEQLDKPAIVWLMIPAQFVNAEITALLQILPAHSIIVDGGNSDFRETLKHGKLCEEKQVELVDVGTSGGILGKDGFSMMVGGNKQAVETVQPLIEALAQPEGWHYFGQPASGHYIKMVHNAIEYGIMESYAEGYHMLKNGPFQGLDLAAAGEVWRHGSIITSLLNDLTVQVLRDNPELDGIEGVVAQSGEALWTLEAAKQVAIPMPAVQAALDVRSASEQGTVHFGTKLLAAMRNKFGGHEINHA